MDASSIAPNYRPARPRVWPSTSFHDYGLIYLDGKKIATLDRRYNQNSCDLPSRDKEATLDIFIEAMGRVNYGRDIKDFKGITTDVELISGQTKQVLTGWDVFSLPLDARELGDLKFVAGEKTDAPTFYRGTFHLDKAGDTFLDMRTWGKGVAWVNGHALGRFWNIGPTQTMYLPGPWLKAGENEVIVFDDKGPEKATLAGLTEPIVNQLAPEAHGLLAGERRYSNPT